jgi:hypothetical protein
MICINITIFWDMSACSAVEMVHCHRCQKLRVRRMFHLKSCLATCASLLGIYPYATHEFSLCELSHLFPFHTNSFFFFRQPLRPRASSSVMSPFFIPSYHFTSPLIKANSPYALFLLFFMWFLGMCLFLHS